MFKTPPLVTTAIATCILLAANAALSQSQTPSRPPQTAKFPVVSLTTGIHLIKAEVVANEVQRQQGLMFREKMGPNEGMVFLFDEPARICMWMKNTLIPLSVAFIDAEGKIINIEDMAPQTTQSHCAKKNALYALEMNRGWFKQKNIKANSVIDGLPVHK